MPITDQTALLFWLNLLLFIGKDIASLVFSLKFIPLNLSRRF